MNLDESLDSGRTMASSSDLVLDMIENDDKGQRIPEFHKGTGY